MLSRQKAKPFIKWVGGKRSLLDTLTDRLPLKYDRYNELFLGGGAFFFNTAPISATLCDANERLCTTYEVVRDYVDLLIEALAIHEKNHCHQYYYVQRGVFCADMNPVDLAATFIYLNKTCFNGLYRVNKSGGFNVPIGTMGNSAILDECLLRAASAALKNADIINTSFEKVVPLSNGFYYLDPPYHKTYTDYVAGGFGEDMHEKLAEYCGQIDRVRGYFMLSNSDTPFIRDLYKGFKIEEVNASRSISCKGNGRGKTGELLIRNY